MLKVSWLKHFSPETNFNKFVWANCQHLTLVIVSLCANLIIVLVILKLCLSHKNKMPSAFSLNALNWKEKPKYVECFPVMFSGYKSKTFYFLVILPKVVKKQFSFPQASSPQSAQSLLCFFPNWACVCLVQTNVSVCGGVWIIGL